MAVSVRGVWQITSAGDHANIRQLASVVYLWQIPPEVIFKNSLILWWLIRTNYLDLNLTHLYLPAYYKPWRA
jgi:hypothetical protein